jgi:hypothetical protein
MAGWLQVWATTNPSTHAVDATRALALGGLDPATQAPGSVSPTAFCGRSRSQPCPLEELVVATIDTQEPLAVAAVERSSPATFPALWRLLAEHPGLAAARLGDDHPGGMSRTLLHVATDWPGHFANGAATIKLLAKAGAEVNAGLCGPHTETPLHRAASHQRRRGAGRRG